MMNQIILDKEQIYEFVVDSIYLPKDPEKMTSRGIDGNYINSPELPAIALPGGDAGELASLYAAANSYSFEIDPTKACQVLASIIGGLENFSIAESHRTQLKKDPTAYSLEPEQINILNIQMNEIKEANKHESVLHGDHQEGAVVIVRGNYGLLPQGTVRTERGRKDVQVFIYHRTFVDKRRKLFAKGLIEKNAVTLYEGLDDEYLYEILTEIGDNHFFETAKKTAQGLPLYLVTIDKPSKIDIKELEAI